MRTALLLVVSLAASCAPDPVRPDLSGSPSGRGVVVHLFEWRWADVAEECETVLGPLGYSAVQVSPPSENHVVEGRPWWERYQPVSYRLETRSGSREAFADMVRRCDEAGVDVIADVILNHMTDADLEHPAAGMTGTGTAGTRFEPYKYPGLYGYDDFHHCGLTPNDDIEDWEDRTQLQECELVDLADLDTGSPRVRAALAAYLRDLAGLGVAGIRIDAARHVPPGDLAAILDSAGWAGYVVQEVANPRDTRLYTPLGDVTDFAYGSLVSRAVREGTLDRLHGEDGIWTADPVPGDSALVFIDNHDNQRGHGVGQGVLMHREGAAYEMSVAFMLAYGRGRPRVMSSFAFETSSQGPPTSGGEETLPVHGPGGAGCGAEWVCEHRRPLVAGLVGFHAAAAGAPVTLWREDAPDLVSFGRGDRAFAAFNASDTLHVFVVDTGLATGEYCDVAQGPPAPDGRCAGRIVTVGARGEAEIPVPPMGAAALHVDAARR